MSTVGSAIGFTGVSLAAGDNLSGLLSAVQLDNVWHRVYLDMNLQRIAFGLGDSLYRTRDQGHSRTGVTDTLTYSLQLKCRAGTQGFSLAYQYIREDTLLDFVGGDSIYLANSIKYANFNGSGGHSRQVRYDLDLVPFGLPGLNFMARYVSSHVIDGNRAPAGGAYNPLGADSRYRSLQGNDGKRWERDLSLRCVFTSGPLKDFLLNVSRLSHRTNMVRVGSDIGHLYLIVEYPLRSSL